MNKRISWLLFLVLICLFSIDKVSALKCSYNFSGYNDETTIWTVDSAYDKPANMEQSIGTISGAGREHVLNWDNDELSGYKAEDDFNNGKCPKYLIQTYYGAWFQGYNVFLSDETHKSKIINSDSVQKFGVFNDDRSVIVYKLKEKEKPSETKVTCSYVDPEDSSYSFSLDYDGNGNLIGSKNISGNTWEIGFQLSYTAYETSLTSNTCNVAAYQCYDSEIGYRRVYLNADGLLSEDASFSADSAECRLYKFDQDTSDSELGEPPTSEAACQAANKYMTALKESAKQYHDCAENGSCSDSGKLLGEFNQNEKQLKIFCNSVYTVAYYSDSCTQYCVDIDSQIAKVKVDNGIEQIITNGNQCTLSDRLVTWIFKIIKWIRYLVPLILIFTTILNFISTIASDKEEEVKKVGAKFVKRLIAAVLIFIVPLILEFLLGIFGIGTNNFCL